MKVAGRKFGVNQVDWKSAVLAAVLSAVLVTGAWGQTLEQNMTAQRKQHIIPGKELHAKGPQL